MRHFPIFLDFEDKRIAISGAGASAAAKIRLVLKTPARVEVFGTNPDIQILQWATERKIVFHERRLQAGDTADCLALYCANDDPIEDGRTAAIGKADGALVNIVDDLSNSQFITPAIVDRDPVTVAIGTEGSAPVLARKLKAEIEEMLPVSTGALARIGSAFRPRAKILDGRKRRNFWARFYEIDGPGAYASGGRAAVERALSKLLAVSLAESDFPGKVWITGVGRGEPEHLTLNARRVLDTADMVFHDDAVSPPILELARREAKIHRIDLAIRGGQIGLCEATKAMIDSARKGLRVVHLKTGAPNECSELSYETGEFARAGIDWEISPGITIGTVPRRGPFVSETSVALDGFVHFREQDQFAAIRSRSDPTISATPDFERATQ